MPARPRVDATVTSQQQQALDQIAIETGLSRSEVVSEAIGLYMKIFMEAKRGHRLVTLDSVTQRPTCELITPTLASMQWTQHIEPVQLSADGMQAVQSLIDEPAAPTDALRDALSDAKRPR